MPIPNPNNGYVPKVGEWVRIVGACHPRSVGMEVEIVSVNDPPGFYQCKWHEERHGWLFGGGVLGGLEPVSEAKGGGE